MIDALQTLQRVDAARRQLGKMLDSLGYGPQPLPSHPLISRPLFELHSYGGNPADPALLIVPAPIKAFYIWDMIPERSVVKRGLEAGRRVYLLRWEHPDRHDRPHGLADYVAAVQEAVAAIEGPVVIAGHSLGGTLAAIYASLEPERLQGLLTVSSPLHFDPDPGAVESLLEAFRPPVPDPLGQRPGSSLSLSAYMAAPVDFGRERWLDWCHSWPDPQATSMHLRVTRWTLDELPMPRQLFEDVLEQLYSNDRFARGELRLGDRLASLARLELPMLILAEARSRVVSPASAYPTALSARGVRVLWYEPEWGVGLQHVGPLIGANCHRQLWPRIQDWLRSIRPSGGAGQEH